MISVQKKSADSQKLSEIQISLLRLFDQGISESETIEVRKMLMDYFDQGLRNELDEVLSKKKYTDQDYRKMLTDDNFMSK
ncbi:MAG: hypothetical protein ABIN80_06355 [Dyadobacter sp.]|uniref:hypothetical protein n=1 Tax=Dyadobacter sp. TaxID=1914288 RepID=UPI003263A432